MVQDREYLMESDDEALQYADSVVVGEVEGIWPNSSRSVLSSMP